MKKIKALIIILSLIVIGLTTSLIVVIVNNSKNNTGQVDNPPSSDVTQTTSVTPSLSATPTIPDTQMTPSPSPNTDTSTKEVMYFTIQFVDYDDTVLDEISVIEGEIPSYTKEIPTRSSDNNSIYRFIGWTPELVEASEDTVYRANYIKDDYFVVSFDANGGMAKPGSQIIEKGKCAVTPEAPTKEHYSFNGWYNNDVLWDFETTINTDVNLVAKWNYNKNNLTITNSDFEKGTISGDTSGICEYNSEITIIATPNAGYNFGGWYSGDSLVSSESTYTFNMPDNDVTLEARWIVRSDISYTVKHYKQNIDNDEYTLADTDNLTGTTATLTEAETKNYEGFTSPTITQESINGDGSTLIELYYIRNSRELLVQNSDSSKGSITDLSGTYKYGETITLVATPTIGYVFVGWFSNNNVLSILDNYEFNMPDNDVLLYAKWGATPDTTYKVKHYKQNIDNDEYTLADTDNLAGATGEETLAIVKNYEGFTAPAVEQKTINGDGSTLVELYYTRNSYTLSLEKDADVVGFVSGEGTYKFGKSVTITVTSDIVNTFEGWYEGDNLISSESTYTFNMPANNLSYEAVFDKFEVIVINNTKLSFSGITSSDKFYSGVELTIKVLDVPTGYNIKFTSNNGGNKTGSEYSFIMPNLDLTITINMISNYKVNGSIVTYGMYPQTKITDLNLITKLNTIEKTNEVGYKVLNGTYYEKYKSNWYKVEPIKWNILKTNTNSYLLASTLMLDAGKYDDDSNNYKNSILRNYLNGSFYTKAFYFENSYVLTTSVDNSASSTGYTTNNNACSNTNDKVFALSVKELKNLTTSSSRLIKPTDYSRGKGCWVDSEGDGCYWTRSPEPNRANCAFRVLNGGSIASTENTKATVSISNDGIRPAIMVRR